MTGTRKKIRRRPDIPEEDRKSRYYFNSGTHDAICAYQKSEVAKERETLYVTAIRPAFERLAENLINIHKFSDAFDTYENLRADTVTFLFETIKKFDPTRGTNSFSYFNVVAKNYLIVRSRQKGQKLRRDVSIEDPDSMTLSERHQFEDHGMIPSQDELLDKRDIVQTIKKTLAAVRSDPLFSMDDIRVIDALGTVLDKIGELEVVSRQALMMYLKELTGLKHKQVSNTLAKVKGIFRTLWSTE